MLWVLNCYKNFFNFLDFGILVDLNILERNLMFGQ